MMEMKLKLIEDETINIIKDNVHEEYISFI